MNEFTYGFLLGSALVSSVLLLAFAIYVMDRRKDKDRMLTFEDARRAWKRRNAE